MTMDQAIPHILSHAPLSYQTMVTSNFSVGMERSLEQLKLNDKDHKMWTNPLESRLPFAPSMSIYCIYGTGKPTERAYFYQNGGYEQGETGLPECSDAGCTNETARVPLDMPLSRRSWIDSTVSMSEEDEPKVRSGESHIWIEMRRDTDW
jgi:phospholipid:diacylglycerol acyltransferase